MTLEVLFEGGGFRRIPESDCNFNPPWPEVCGGLHFALIVLLQPKFQIPGESGVVAIRIGEAAQLVDVVEHGRSLPWVVARCRGLPGRSLERSLTRLPVLPRLNSEQ